MILWLLICGHALADFPLQGDFLACGKNQTNPIPGVPWWQCLLAHSLIHGGTVTLITGSVGLGFIEFCVHATIDFQKCKGTFGYNVDQALHILTKLVLYYFYVHGWK